MSKARQNVNKLNSFVSVLDYGVKADGATDDTTAFQAALNSGRDLQLAEGIMIIGQVTSSASGQKVSGSPNTIIKHKAAVNTNLILISGAEQVWTGFTIDGNAANVTYTYNSFELDVFAADVVISNVYILNANSGGIRGRTGAERLELTSNYIQNCGDFGIFVNDTAGTSADPSGGICADNTVINFGSQGGGGGATPSVGIGIRSQVGGWRIVNNRVKQTASYTNYQLGIECWTNSNNMIVTGNIIDMSVANSGEFGLSVTGYGSVVNGNVIQGTSSYGIEIIDRAVSCTGNVLRSPGGAGIAINLNAGHSDPGDVMTISGNTIENTSSTSVSFAGIVVAGDPTTTPVAITINGNTIFGLSQGILVDSQVVSYVIANNTLYNTGSTSVGISANGADGAVIGNNVFRVSAAGTGNGGHIIINGDGVLMTGNRISGNGRIDNAIVLSAGVDNCLVSGNLITGVTNAIFSNSTSTTVIVRDNVSTAGVSLNAANYGEQHFNLTNKTSASQGVTTSLGSFTVANLPTSSVIAGTTAYASNGRKAGEGAGAGTGVVVFRDASNWIACDTGATVAA